MSTYYCDVANCYSVARWRVVDSAGQKFWFCEEHFRTFYKKP